jgi:hypothetical protein
VIRYHTKSGSVYEVRQVDGKPQVRRASGGPHYKGRCDDWKPCESVELTESPGTLLIGWGLGRDEFSPDDDGIPDDLRYRVTETSKVLHVEVVPEPTGTRELPY